VNLKLRQVSVLIPLDAAEQRSKKRRKASSWPRQMRR